MFFIKISDFYHSETLNRASTHLYAAFAAIGKSCFLSNSGRFCKHPNKYEGNWAAANTK